MPAFCLGCVIWRFPSDNCSKFLQPRSQSAWGTWHSVWFLDVSLGSLKASAVLRVLRKPHTIQIIGNHSGVWGLCGSASVFPGFLRKGNDDVGFNLKAY
eukprot:3983844-Amphidinium_carterae.1